MGKETESRRDQSTKVNTQLADVLKDIPLEKCEFRVDPVTNKSGWYAPVGFAFRMVGEFVTKCDQSGGDYTVYVPIASDLLFATNPEDWSYQNEADIKGPIEFVGKWLDINIVEAENESFLSAPKGKHEMRFFVRENLEAYYDNAYYLEFNDYLLPLNNAGDVEWTQLYAEGKVGHCHLAIIPYVEKDSELIVPTHTDTLNQVALPLGVNITKEE